MTLLNQPLTKLFVDTDPIYPGGCVPLPSPKRSIVRGAGPLDLKIDTGKSLLSKP